MKILPKVFFVRSKEQIFCPCCGGDLKVIGSRHRECIEDTGKKMDLVIRRMRCSNCRKIHHELPDILVPYKRYRIECIEAVLSEDTKLSVPADESTIKRWRNWFKELAIYLLGCLMSITIRYGRESVEEECHLPKSKLQRIWHYVGDASKWLARVVRPVVNSNLWLHTRSAFPSK